MALSLHSELLRSSGFRHGFSLRAGGVSAGAFASLNLGRAVGDDPAHVEANHRLFAAEIGYDPARLYEVSQVHGARVQRADPQLAPALFREREADALVSASAGCAVGIRVADCVPLLLADPTGGSVAAIHAGWRGIVADVIAAGVDALCECAGAAPASLVAAIFPAIGVAAFEVGSEVADAIRARIGDERVIQRGGAKPHVDLALSARLALTQAGLASEAVDHVAGCTFEERARFYSFRRDGGRTGRHLAVIVPRC